LGSCIVFRKSAKTEPVNFGGARDEEALIEFLNKQTGTHRLPGGALTAEAGRVPDLDELAKKMVAATSKTEEESIIEEVGKLVSKTPSKYVYRRP
jgi:protein disulfide-isomerase A6